MSDFQGYIQNGYYSFSFVKDGLIITGGVDIDEEDVAKIKEECRNLDNGFNVPSMMAKKYNMSAFKKGDKLAEGIVYVEKNNVTTIQITNSDN